MIAAFLLCSAQLGGEEGNRLHWVELELEGPLDSLVLDAGAAGETRVAAELLAGESRRVRLPVPLDPPAVEGGRELALATIHLSTTPSTARARILGLAAGDEDELASLPRTLLRRTRPPVGPARLVASKAEILIVLFAGLAGLARRWRWSARLGVALVLGVIAAASALARASGPTSVRVIEGDLGAGAWLEVRGAHAELELAGLERLEVDPPGSRLSIEIDGLDHPGVVRAKGASLYGIRRESGPGPGLEQGSNPFVRALLVWSREAGGPWRFLGLLPPLGPPPASPPDPRVAPGWLVGALTSSRSAWVGRLESAEAQEYLRVLFAP